jgi:hypothetical protein
MFLSEEERNLAHKRGREDLVDEAVEKIEELGDIILRLDYEDIQGSIEQELWKLIEVLKEKLED